MDEPAPQLLIKAIEVDDVAAAQILLAAGAARLAMADVQKAIDPG